MAAAAETFNESFWPAMGIIRWVGQTFSKSSSTPPTSLPITRASFGGGRKGPYRHSSGGLFQGAKRVALFGQFGKNRQGLVRILPGKRVVRAKRRLLNESIGFGTNVGQTPIAFIGRVGRVAGQVDS